MAFFGYSFFARQHLEGIARDFVIQKTLEHSAPLIEVVEAGIKTPAVRKWLTQDQMAAIEQEIADYRKNPADFIGSLTGQQQPVDVARKFNNAAVLQVANWKSRIQNYYVQTLSRLILDLRIFAGSNVVAAMVAFLGSEDARYLTGAVYLVDGGYTAI